MRVTERLNVEHGVILEELDQLEALLRHEAPEPVLVAVVQTLARGTASHLRLEEEHLRPALVKALGGQFPPLEEMRREHAEILGLLQVISGSSPGRQRIAKFADKLRAHLEKGIHLLSPLAEEWISSDELASMCDWNVEHVIRRSGARSGPWPEQWLG